MREYAHSAGLLPLGHPGVLEEEWARDTFENVFFSILAYRCEFGEWPGRIAVVSWKFKALRSYLIGLGLGYSGERFRFIGRGDPQSAVAAEKVSVASVGYDSQIVDLGNGRIADPLHRSADFASKRVGRMPDEFRRDNDAYLQAVERAYDVEVRSGRAPGPVSRAMRDVESIEPGDGWRELSKPWARAGS